MEERELNGLTIGYKNSIDFNNLCDDNNHHTFTFQKMKTKDNSFLVLVYQWADRFSKTFNDQEEAFYIANIDAEKYEMADEIIFKVYVKIRNAFYCDNFKIFDLASCVDDVLKDYQKRVK